MSALQGGQFRRPPGILIAGYVAFALFVVVVQLADVVAIELFRDPLELGGPADTHPWKGSFSVLGVFCWSASAAVCLFAGTLVRASGTAPERAIFLLATGGLFLVLGFDDGLLVHDHWAERVTGLEISQPITSAFLFLLIGLWLVRFRGQILTTNVVLLGLALAGLVIAQTIDMATELDIRSDAANLTEEAVEFGAVVTFLVWAAGESRRAVRDLLPRTSAP